MLTQTILRTSKTSNFFTMDRQSQIGRPTGNLHIKFLNTENKVFYYNFLLSSVSYITKIEHKSTSRNYIQTHT